MAADRMKMHWLADGIGIQRRKNLSETMEQLNRQIAGSLLRERIPLILAGSYHQQEAFRKSCSYLNLLDRGVVRNVDDLSVEALTNLSLETMVYHFDELDNRSVVAFHRAEASGLASTDLVEIARAAARGQVQSLLVAEDQQVWGKLDRKTGEIRVLEQPSHTTADDLLDDLAELTINKGGGVTVLPSLKMPGNRLICAVLRWSETPLAMPLTHIAMRGSWIESHGHVQEFRT